jgi:hypothetical protein
MSQSACAATVAQDEEGIGDVDLFTLTEDRKALTVNAKWLQHLQVCPVSTAQRSAVQHGILQRSVPSP